MATNDIVLGSALRSNLLTLQSTQRQIDVTQLRLATGKKVNSALDNPQSFFTSQALNNRASDLTRLLDGIGQSIKTIQEADKGVTALTSLVEQAQSIASSARDELAASDGEARALGNVDLRTVTNLVGFGGIAAGDQFRITTTNDAGLQIQETVTITANDSAYTLAAKITDQFADSRAGEITARITEQGFLEIKSTGGRSFKMGESSIVTATATNIGLAGYQALGLDRYFENEQRGAAANITAQALVVAGNTVSSISLYESTGNLLDAGDVIVGTNLNDASGTAVVANLQVGDGFNFTINNSGTATTGNIAFTATTSWQDVIDQINQTAAVNTLISAEFDSSTGQIKITALSDTVQDLQIGFTTGATAANRTFDVGFGDPFGTLDAIAGGPSAVQAATQLGEQVISFNNSTQALDALAADYNVLREQIDALVQDAQYRGVNLLRGDNLTTFFNEDSSNLLVTEGANFTSLGLGLNQAQFRSLTDIEATASEAFEALNTVRAFGSSLANNLSIIQTRQVFTQETINTLKAGAAELTDADPNEEGANLLALQTRQQLGVTALSLASQSQQSVLRLF
jgi:flagellin